MIKDGVKDVVILPFEHLVMYDCHRRLGVVIRRGVQCECCFLKGVTFALVNRGRCKSFAVYTADGMELTIDHIIPKASGGKDEEENYQILCRACNTIKGDREITLEELRCMIKNMYGYVVNTTTPKVLTYAK